MIKRYTQPNSHSPYAEHRADSNDYSGPVESSLGKGCREGGSQVDVIVGHEQSQSNRRPEIEDGGDADCQTRRYGDRLGRLLGLLPGRRDPFEADVGVEAGSGPRKHPREAVREESAVVGVGPVITFSERQPGEDDGGDDGEVDHREDGVDADGRLSSASYEDGESEDDAERHTVGVLTQPRHLDVADVGESGVADGAAEYCVE